MQLVVALGVPLPSALLGQVPADPNFDPKVARPAYPKRHPKVLFDEAHSNFHTSADSYKPFVDLITKDGYQVAVNNVPFSESILKGHQVLVIVSALAPESKNAPAWSAKWFFSAANSAFSEEECEAVSNWVRGGGSLLLITDHRPFGSAAKHLAKRFGVETGNGYLWDSSSYYKEMDGGPGNIIYEKEKGMIADHPIMRGRGDAEQVSRIMTFVGQSLKGSAGSTALLKVTDAAIERQTLLDTSPELSAAGRAQAVALKFGKGRVVMLGEAAMLTAQSWVGNNKKIYKAGMNHPGIDNRQLALNIMHWLSGLFD